MRIHDDQVPPVGRRLDVGGRQLFVHQIGTGQPAVVFLPGAGMVGLDYLNLHQRIAEQTTAVLYDRAGTGWSDAVDLPRTGAQVTDELRDVLGTAGVAGPYVLVGHSLGGAYARRFAQRFPDDVAGLVLLEPAHEDWDTHMVDEQLSLAASQTTFDDLPPLGDAILQQIRGMYEEKLAAFPNEIRDQLVDYHLRNFSKTVEERGNLLDLLEELRTGGETPDVPTIVVTVLGVDPGQAMFLTEDLLRRMNEGKLSLYQALADSVPRGEHRVLPAGGHSMMHLEQPEPVVQAIHDVLDRVRG